MCFSNIAFTPARSTGDDITHYAGQIFDVYGHPAHSSQHKSKAQRRDRDTPPKKQAHFRDLQLPEPLNKAVLRRTLRQIPHRGRFLAGLAHLRGTAPIRDTTVENRNVQYGSTAGLKHIRIQRFPGTPMRLFWLIEGINNTRDRAPAGPFENRNNLEYKCSFVPRAKNNAQYHFN
jgi:hypothetical protein